MANTTPEVECLECNRFFKALGAHVAQKHEMSLDDYRKKFRDPVTGEDPPVGYVVPPNSGKAGWKAAAAQAVIDDEVAEKVALSPIRAVAVLNAKEQERFAARFKTLFWQADEDPALESTVQNIVLNEIHIDRYNEQISRLTQSLGRTTKPTDVQQLNLLSKLVKDTQSTNLSLMQSLSITRDQKQKNKKVIESTPSRFVTALESLVRNTSGEQLRRVNQEMAEAARRLQLNLSALRELVPSDVVAVEGTEGDADGDDIV